MADSERQHTTSYSRIIIIVGLSLTVSMLAIGVCLWTGNDVMPISTLDGVAAADFLFAVNYDFLSIFYRFRVISVCGQKMTSCSFLR